MKILIAFDSFKGSLSSLEAGKALKSGLESQIPYAEIEVVAAADGGEGSLEMISKGKVRHEIEGLDPLGRPIKSYFLGLGNTAYLEMATTSGLLLLAENERNPLLTNTCGLGQQMEEAIKLGYKKLVVFAGGSATNDAGLGALQALGFRFFDSDGKEVNPIGQNLRKIVSFSRSFLLELPEIEVATDVQNPFTGPQGATYVFAPQKGADSKALKVLETGLLNIASLFPEIEINSIPGSGAAGGLAGGFHLFLNAKICPATSLLFEQAQIKEKIKNADFVITGEGKLDEQTLSGKLVSRIFDICPKEKLILIAGKIETDFYKDEVFHISELTDQNFPENYALENAERLMCERACLIYETLIKGK